MENNRASIAVINKDMLCGVIDSLKNIRPMDYDGMNRLVGCVIVLERALNDPFSKEVEDVVNLLLQKPDPESGQKPEPESTKETKEEAKKEG